MMPGPGIEPMTIEVSERSHRCTTRASATHCNLGQVVLRASLPRSRYQCLVADTPLSSLLLSSYFWGERLCMMTQVMAVSESSQECMYK